MPRNPHLEEAKCHYVSAAIAIASAVSSAAISAQQQRKAKRKALNASQLAGENAGSGGEFSTVASKFATGEDRGGGGARLGDALKGAASGTSEPATAKEQGFSLGVKNLGDLDQPAHAQSFDNTFHADANTALPVSEVKQEPQGAPAVSDTGSAVGQGVGYAKQAYDLYNQLKSKPPEPLPLSRSQGTVTQPTANRFLVR